MTQKVLFVLVITTLLLAAYNTYLLHTGLVVTFNGAPTVESF
jgi:hypothetical protein